MLEFAAELIALLLEDAAKLELAADLIEEELCALELGAELDLARLEARLELAGTLDFWAEDAAKLDTADKLDLTLATELTWFAFDTALSDETTTIAREELELREGTAIEVLLLELASTTTFTLEEFA